MKKKFRYFLVAAGVLFVLAVVFWMVFASTLMVNAAQRAASEMLDTEVRIGNINLCLLRGRLEIENIEIANLEDFDDPDIMTVGRVEVLFSTLSALTDTFKLQKIEVSDVNINIQQKGIRNNLREFQAAIAPEAEPEKETSEGKHVAVDRVKIEGISLNLNLGGARSSLGIDPIILEDVGTRDGISPAMLIARVSGAVASGALRQMGSLIPSNLFEEGGVIRSIPERSLEKTKSIMESIGSIFSGQKSEE